jgi:hypothetical protein
MDETGRIRKYNVCGPVKDMPDMEGILASHHGFSCTVISPFRAVTTLIRSIACETR